MEGKIKLGPRIVDLLTSLPESGMGYQKVDIHLSDGGILRDRMVFNSTYLQLHQGEQIVPEQIKEVSLSQ